MAPALDPSNRTFSVNAADNGSGIALVEKRDVGSSDWTPVAGPEVLGDDAAHLELRATDHAGHESTKTVHVLARAEAGVSLSLGSSPTYGKANTATVVVTAPSGWPTPTGTVTIKDGTKVIATGPLSGGTAAIPLPTLGAGSHGLTASYSGDSRTKAGASVIQTVTVKKATPTVTFKLSTSKPRVSSTKVKVTVNLRIAGSSIRPANYVYIRLNGRTIKTMLISSAYAGTRSVSLPVFKQKGTFQLSVRYQGSSNVYSGTSSSQTITVR